MSKIILSDSMEDVFVKMSGGNPGALRVCLELYTQDKVVDPQGLMLGLWPLLRLDDMGIYSSEIWMLYKDVCNSSIIYLLALLRANQLGHIAESQIKLAIRGGHAFDLEAILANVKTVSPNFASEATNVTT